MSYITPSQVGRKVEHADGGTDSPLYPLTTVIADDEYTVPIDTVQMSAVIISVEPADTGASAEIEARPAPEAAWYLYDTLDLSAGDPVAKQIPCPIGQLRVKMIDKSGTVWVQGLLNI